MSGGQRFPEGEGRSRGGKRPKRRKRKKKKGQCASREIKAAVGIQGKTPIMTKKELGVSTGKNQERGSQCSIFKGKGGD